MKFIRKNLFTLLLILAFGLMIYPPTGIPIKAFVHSLVMFSPKILDEEERVHIDDYNWKLKRIDGGSKNFSESKNRIAIVNLWATWCPPCIAELPAMQRLYDSYSEEVDFYFVTAEDEDTVKRFLLKKGYDIPIFLEIEKPPVQMQVSTIPTTFLIDKEGNIIIQKTGAAKWDSEEVRSILDNLLQ